MLRKLLLIIVFILIFVKFFTAEISFQDDPTTGIILKCIPSWNNYVLITEYPIKYYFLIGPDESYVGEEIYSFIVSIGWLVIPILWIYIKLFSLIKKHKF